MPSTFSSKPKRKRGALVKHQHGGPQPRVALATRCRSLHSCYAGLEKMKWFLDSEPIRGVFESYTGRCWKALEYRRLVEEGLIGEIEDPFEAVKWQQVLGGEGFLRKLKDHWNQRVERPKNYGQKRNWSSLGAEQVLARVSEHFQCDPERLKERSIRNNLARRCAIPEP